MPKTITYKTSQGIYEIPENEKDDFLKDFSDTTEVESFVVGKDIFDIPLSDVDEFKSEVKDAKPLKKKEQAAGVTGTWQDSIPSQSEEMETMSTSKGEPVENFKIPDFNTPAPDTVIDKTQSLEPVDEQMTDEQISQQNKQSNEEVVVKYKPIIKQIRSDVNNIIETNTANRQKEIEDRLNSGSIKNAIELNKLSKGYKDDFNKVRPVLKMLNDIESKLNTVDGEKSIKEALKVKAKNLEDVTSLGWSKVADNINIVSLANKYKEGEQLSPEEEMTLAIYAIKKDIDSNIETPMSYDVTTGIVDMIPYMVQFALTGSVATSVEGVVNKALKTTAQKTIGNFAKKGAVYTLGKAVQTPAFSMLYERATEGQIKDVKANIKDGKIAGIEVGDKKESLAESISKGYGITFSEVFTEGFFTKIGGSKVNKGVVNKVKDAIQWSNLPGEFTEEMINAGMSGVIEGQDLKEVYSQKNVLTTLVQVSLVCGAIQTANTLSGNSKYRDKSKEALNKAAKSIDKETKSEIDNIISSNTTADELAANLEPLINEGVGNKGWGKDELTNINTYITNKIAEKSANITKKEAESKKRQPISQEELPSYKIGGREFTDKDVFLSEINKLKGKENTPEITINNDEELSKQINDILKPSAIVEDVKKEKLTSSATQEKEASKQPKKESKLPNNVIQTKEGLFELNEDQQSQREEMTEKYGKERADELIKDFIDVNDLKKYNVGVQETKTKENELQEEKTTEEVKPKEEVVETPKKEPKGKEIAFEFTGQQRFGKIIEENTDDRGKYLKVEDETGTIHRIRGNSIAHQKVTVDKAEIKKIKESLGYEPSKVSSAQMESKGKLEGGIEMPEMVEAVKKLIGNTPSINKYKKTLGRFYHNKKGSGIGLSSKLFKEGNETQTSFVIGHEMGHMVDYLPENTIRKGRILNRLYSIKEDVQDNIKNEKQLREELSKLSKIWNPYNEKTDAKYTTYRKRPSELYADAVSVFLNNPEMLKKEAPLFDKLFKEKFGEKANVQDVYNEILDLYEGGDVIENRIKNIERGYKEAESKRRRDLVKEKDKLNELEKFIKGFVSESHPLYTRMKDQKGITSELGDKNKLRNDLENLAFSNERQARFLVDTEKAVKDPIKEAGINPIDFDMLFQIERELTQRKDIANPQGRFRKHNEQIKKRIFSKYDDKQAKLIWDKKKEFHDAAFKVVKKFYEAGGISDDTWVNTIKPNRDVYATYSVVDYIDGSYSSPFIKQSTGTLKDIENPYVSTLYKLSAMIKETEKLNAIKNLTEVYNKHFPGEITHAKFKDGNWIVPKGKALLKTVDNGATVGLAVDPYIAEFFNKSHKEMDSATKLFKFFNKGFKPLVTTWNIGWAFYSNIARDRGRTLVNMNAILGGMKELNPANVTKALTEFYGNTKDSYKEAAKFVKGELTPLAREMVEGGVITHGFFGTYDAYANESMEPLFKKLGVLKGEKTAREKMSKVPIVNLGIKLLDALEFAGSVGEVSTKINAYKVFRKRMSPEAAAFYTRNYAGTPNYLERGNNTRTTNEIFAFSNVIAQSIRTDLEMSTKPSTAGGYWLHTAARIVIPQMIVSFAAAGLLGDELKRLYNKIPEYDKVNYLCIVTGKNQDDNPMYLRIPIPEFQRLVHALTYNITTGIADKELKNPTKTFDLFTDLFPSISPLWKVVGGWKAYLSGKNPYDEFYGSYVLDKYKDPEGWQSTKKMLKWSVSSIGGRPIIKLFDYDRTKGRTTEYVIKNIPVLNRALKVGNRGLVEQYLNKADDIRKEKTQLKIKQDKIIDKYVKKAIMNNLTVSDPETGIYNIDIMDEIMEKKLYKDILDIPNIKTGVKLRFNTKLNRGVNSAEDQLIDALTIVKDNDSKKEIINMYMDAYPEKNILDLLIFLKSNEIISDNLMKASFIYYNDNMLKTDNNEK